MDNTVLYSITYGIYIVGVMDGERPCGCVINTCFQVTSANPTVAISMNKNNFTYEAIKKSGKFNLSIIAEDTDPNVISSFGFRCGKDCDKYEGFGHEMWNGTPIVNGKFAGRMAFTVKQIVDCDTHMLIVAQLDDTIKGEGTPMTYSYYHKVIKGSAPKNAPTYVEKPVEKVEAPKTSKGGMHRYVCDVCGYVVEAESLPDDFICPICKMDRSHFIEE